MCDRETLLTEEAVYMHKLFFGATAPVEVVRQYVAANLRCPLAADGSESGAIHKIVTRELDAEAIEFVLRCRRQSRTLTQKVHILFYLVEVRTHYSSWFVSTAPGRWRALAAVAWALLRSSWKYAKGSYLVWRHRLV